MLTAEQIDALVDPILELYERYQVSVIRDIARRLSKMNYTTETAAWQMQRLTESGAVYENALKEISKLTGLSERSLRKMFERAGVQAMRFDDSIYRRAGLNPIPLNLSPSMAAVLAAGLRKTNGVARNLTLTTAGSAQQAFIDAADLAYMQISSGAFDYQTALASAVKNVADQGLTVINYASGRREQLDVAMRRSVLTGVSQTVGKLQEARIGELGVDLVQTSAHAGARNHGTGPANHESWQGKVFSFSGTNPSYPNFRAVTGYGTGEGLMGYNCVVGETQVSGPVVRAAYRREYTGEIIVLRTASGKELTVTPNHPILTDQGWVAAGLLAEGDNVISRSGLDGVNSAGPDPDHNEPRIEDVFDSLAQGGDVLRLPVSACHFHGDVSDGEVNAVFPKGLLRGWDYAAFFEHGVEVPFCLAADSTHPLPADRRVDKILFGSRHPADGIMGSPGQIGAPFRPNSLQPDAHGFRSIFCQGDSKFSQVLPNPALGDTNLLRNLPLPEPRVVHGEKFVWTDAGLPPQVGISIATPLVDPVSLKAVEDSLQGAPVLCADSSCGNAGSVQTDHIIFIERKSAEGSFIHVYNLETAGGWYYANGIVTHNCRHSYYPFFEGISENAYNQAQLDSFANAKVTYQGKEISFYDATQAQRRIERGIRFWKRRAAAVEAAGLDNTAQVAKVKAWQERMREFTRQTGLDRDYFREKVILPSTDKKLQAETLKTTLGEIRSLKPDQVMPVGEVNKRIVAQWTNAVEGNQAVVLTGKQRSHYIGRHKEMEAYEHLLSNSVLYPDEVHRNKRDKGMAIFYMKYDQSHYLRTAVLMQPSPGDIKHSILSYRMAGVDEVEKGRRGGRQAWKK